MKKLLNLNFFFLLLLTIAAFALRFWNLDKAPPSLNWDEISHGYNAYSLLLTGKDEWGFSWPLIFRAFGDYKLPLYIYLTAPFVTILGLSTVAIRLVSVLAGTLAIPGIYLLTNEFFPKSLILKLRTTNYELKTGVIASFILTLTPWHFFISRPALEANLGLTLFIFGLWALLKSLKNSKFLLLASLFLSLTLHTYNSYRLLTPLIIVTFFIIYYLPRLSVFDKFNKIFKLNLSSLPNATMTHGRSALSKLYAKEGRPWEWKVWGGIALTIFIISLSLVIYQFINGTGSARYSQLAILNPNSVYQIGQNRTLSHLPDPLNRLIYNRPLYFSGVFIAQYLSYFSPTFLYQLAGTQTQFAIPGQNLLTLPITIFFLLGLWFLVNKPKSNQSAHLLFLLSGFLLSPRPAAITSAPPQALRPTPLLPFMIIIAVFGLVYLVRRLPIRLIPLLISLTTVSLAFFFAIYLKVYFGPYQKTYSQAWQYGYEQAIAYIAHHQNEYVRVFISKQYAEPHIFYAFYTHLNPRALQSGASSVRFSKSDWYWTDQIDNTFLVNHWLIPNGTPAPYLPLEIGSKVPTQNSLLVTTPDHLPSNTTTLETINFLDGSPAFIIVKFNQ